VSSLTTEGDKEHEDHSRHADEYKQTNGSASRTSYCLEVLPKRHEKNDDTTRAAKQEQECDRPQEKSSECVNDVQHVYAPLESPIPLEGFVGKSWLKVM
jgi:hypothetical protein